MNVFRLDNTEGFNAKQLEKLNADFEIFASKLEFDLDDPQQMKSACDLFWNSL